LFIMAISLSANAQTKSTSNQNEKISINKKGGVYDYEGNKLGFITKENIVKDSKGNKIESGEESPFTAHFKNADKYPAGKYTVCMEVRPWTKGNGCGKDTIFSSCGVVNIILTPKGDITE